MAVPGSIDGAMCRVGRAGLIAISPLTATTVDRLPRIGASA